MTAGIYVCGVNLLESLRLLRVLVTAPMPYDDEAGVYFCAFCEGWLECYKERRGRAFPHDTDCPFAEAKRLVDSVQEDILWPTPRQ